jgi:GT2 family glycosyltransferase
VAMTSPTHQVSIIVNSYNPKGDPRVRAMTEYALHCYHDFTGPAHELILVDGDAGPDPLLDAVCAQLGYRYLHLGRRLSFAEGYNAGLRAAGGPWRVLAASDILVVAGWLEGLLDAAEGTGAWMVSPYLSQSDYPAQRLHHVISRRTYAPQYLTFNLNLISPRCMEAAGYLDEQLSGCFNDVDYTLRIREQGGEVALAYCGEITHIGRGTLGLDGIRTMYARDLPVFEAKWPGVWNSRTYRLNDAGGLEKWLLRLERILPSRLRRHCLGLIDRVEPIISCRRLRKH